MNRYRRALGLFAAGAIAVLMGFTVSTPAAKAAPATKLLVDCCTDGVVGDPQTFTLRPVDDNGLDDGSFRGTVTFFVTFTDDFTVEPHDDAEPHQYTFKDGDVTDGGTAGKQFTIVFNEPGTGTFQATSPGLQSVNLPDTGHTNMHLFTIEPAQAPTTTTTTMVETTTTTGVETTTTTVPGSTTTTVPGATTTTVPGTTTTTIVPATTTTTFAPGATTTFRTSTTIIRTGAPIGPTAAAGTALFVIGALCLLAGAIEVQRSGNHYLPKN